jgi:hypothetical protein
MSEPKPPLLVVLYQGTWDQDGNASRWEVPAWGLYFEGGQAVTVPTTGRPSVTLWQTLDDACEHYEAVVDTINPRPFARWSREGGRG